MGNYRDAIKCYEKADLNNLSLTSSNSCDRRLQLIAEAFAMKGANSRTFHVVRYDYNVLFAGLSLEKTSSSDLSAAEKTSRDNVIMDCFERSGDISLVILQAYQEREMSTLLSNKVHHIPCSKSGYSLSLT